MTERDFEDVVGYAQDLFSKAVRHRFEGRGIRIQFFSDDDSIVEVRWIRKPPEQMNDL